MREIIFSDEQVAALDAAAEALIPGDDFDGGVGPLGPGSVIATRARYQEQVAGLYLEGLAAIDDTVAIMFGPGRRFPALSLAERGRVLEAVRRGTAPGARWGAGLARRFFEALRADVTFVYLTDPDVCRRLGFPGPSTLTGGYPDFDRPQS